MSAQTRVQKPDARQAGPGTLRLAEALGRALVQNFEVLAVRVSPPLVGFIDKSTGVFLYGMQQMSGRDVESWRGGAPDGETRGVVVSLLDQLVRLDVGVKMLGAPEFYALLPKDFRSRALREAFVSGKDVRPNLPTDDRIRLLDLSGLPRLSPQREQQIAERIERRTQRPEKRSPPRDCPACGEATFEFASDLEFEWARAGERTVLANLSGHRCSRCGETAFDMPSSRIISRHYSGQGTLGAHRARVSGLSGDRLGIYLPKDLILDMRLERGDEFQVVPLTADKFIALRVKEQK